jgi:hypothetical protein
MKVEMKAAGMAEMTAAHLAFSMADEWAVMSAVLKAVQKD